MKMKLVFSFVLTTILIVLIAGCGQQGTNNPTGVTGGIGEIADNPSGSLIGTWYSENIEEDWKDVLYFTFNSDGSFLLEIYEYEMYGGEWNLDYYESTNGAYEVDDNQLTLYYGGTVNFTYSIQGDSLTLYLEGEPLTFTRFYGNREVQPLSDPVDENINSNKDHKSALKHLAKTGS